MKARTLAALAAVLLTTTAPGAAQAADQLAISAPASAPGTEVPVTTTVTPDANGFTYAYARRGGTDCAPTAAEEEARPDASIANNGNFAPAGKTTQSTANVRANRPGRYRLCAYLIDTDGPAPPRTATPKARAEGELVVGDPNRGEELSIEVVPTYDLTAGPPPQLTLRGHSTDGGRIADFIEFEGADCAPTAVEQGQRPTGRALNALSVQAGAFAVSDQLAYTARSGTYRICSYLRHNADPAGSPSRAVATATIVVTGGDKDRDGVKDQADRCPTDRGPAPVGCPTIAFKAPSSIKLSRQRFIQFTPVGPARCSVKATTTLLGTKLRASGNTPLPVLLRIPKGLAKRLARRTSTKATVNFKGTCGRSAVTTSRRVTIKR